MAYTYILECGDGSFYVGSTKNLEARVGEHQAGLGAVYTARRLPVVLRWSAEFEQIDEVYLMEKQIQGLSRAKRLALIEGRYADLPGLAKGSRSGEGG